MIRALVARTLVCCALAAAALVGVSLAATPALVQDPAGGTGDDVDEAAQPTRTERRAARVADLVAAHRCWTGAAPAGAPAPTRAVVSLPGRGPALVGAEVGYGVWLDGDAGVVHGFCP